jgi:hypothetical protein
LVVRRTQYPSCLLVAEQARLRLRVERRPVRMKLFRQERLSRCTEMFADRRKTRGVSLRDARLALFREHDEQGVSSLRVVEQIRAVGCEDHLRV